jgi:hypothetical protein
MKITKHKSGNYLIMPWSLIGSSAAASFNFTRYWPYLLSLLILLVTLLVILLVLSRGRRKQKTAITNNPAGTEAAEHQGVLCEHCQKPISWHEAVCPYCGARICPACHAANDQSARYCGNCGQNL